MKVRIPDVEVKAFALLAILIFVLYLPLREPRFNYLENISKLNPQGFASSLTTCEVNAAIFLSENVRDQETLIVSDPYTMYFLQAVCNVRVAMTESVWIQDSEYSSEALLQMKNLRNLFSGIWINNTAEDTNATVIYDDNEAFWSTYYSGSGTLGITLTEQQSEKVKGASSLKIVVGAGTYGETGICHIYNATQDWSSGGFFDFWWNGAGSGNKIEIRIFTINSGAFTYAFTENFSGWKRVIIPFADFNSHDGNWNGIQSIYFLTLNSEGTYYIDRTVVDSANWSYASDDVRVFHDKLINMFPNYDKIVVVYSRRTSTWANSDQNFVDFPSKTVDMQFGEILSRHELFILNFAEQNDIYVFTLK